MCVREWVCKCVCCVQEKTHARTHAHTQEERERERCLVFNRPLRDHLHRERERCLVFSRSKERGGGGRRERETERQRDNRTPRACRDSAKVSSMRRASLLGSPGISRSASDIQSVLNVSRSVISSVGRAMWFSVHY